MITMLLLFIGSLLFLPLQASQTLHKEIDQKELHGKSIEWEQTGLTPFNELIVSWDAQRPKHGYYLIKVSLLTDNKWSPWLNYAYWGSSHQYTFNCHPRNSSCKTYQDVAGPLGRKKATGFKIRVDCSESSLLKNIRTLHASFTNIQEHKVSFDLAPHYSINLNVKGLSQVTLPDERHMRLCSPTSTTAVINYLSPGIHLSALTFADHVKDSAFDIYGNWLLNTAEASNLLGPSWHSYVARLNNFDQIMESLSRGFPVVVSIKGPLTGSASPYSSGHLIVVKGYEAEKQQVLCMDPAFPTDQSTLVSYSLKDFLVAWNRRKGIAYLFYR
ncbi:hypothetical protein DB41_GZ00070 [Neochlamydia sp. TUME1]|uniref:C39 family peptidase n=1 Tax=Neochlamydia sp. TUME1 TaxID=1478174 RepID=UPI000583D66E|nr:C39 family peptidase [Neochlamydia sp. TUME1]KIC75843.1 hypothetical protein DB41_GZ00070 [Neochlamydia sp. TUME1]